MTVRVAKSRKRTNRGTRREQVARTIERMKKNDNLVRAAPLCKLNVDNLVVVVREFVTSEMAHVVIVRPGGDYKNGVCLVYDPLEDAIYTATKLKEVMTDILASHGVSMLKKKSPPKLKVITRQKRRTPHA